MKVLEAKVKNPALLELDRKALDAGRLYIDHTVAIGASHSGGRLRGISSFISDLLTSDASVRGGA